MPLLGLELRRREGFKDSAVDLVGLDVTVEESELEVGRHGLELSEGSANETCLLVLEVAGVGSTEGVGMDEDVDEGSVILDEVCG